MNVNMILSTSLPELDLSFVECINLGQWMLFKPDYGDNDGGELFYLKADERCYLLSSNGALIRKVNLNEYHGVRDVYYFSDIPRPTSISNYSIR